VSDEELVRLPSGALVILVGAPGSGKSTFAAELVRQGKVDPAAVVSSDDIAVQMFGPTVDREAADPYIFGERDRRLIARLRAGLTSVVDATNVRVEARERLVAIARRFGVPVVVLRFERSDEVLIAQNSQRSKRLPVPEVRGYAALMTAHASAEQLRAERVWAVHDVPGRDQQVNPAQAAARFAFDDSGSSQP
jgi:predicted kinase